MMKSIMYWGLLLLTQMASGQYRQYDPNNPPNEFRSENNPYYWQNRKPYEGYWQQDVYYRIKAEVNENTDIITGEELLTYWNNSPDTLPYVYFHLYQQAFVKGGHLENLNRNNNFRQRFGRYESHGKGEIVESFHVNGVMLKTEQDFSVVKVYLNHPLLPGDSITFDIRFKTYFDNGNQRRRMKKFEVQGFKHFDGVHWYPRICVYDAKLGWDTYQHLGKEFYGNFGTYDVALTFAANYVVGATGTLLNEEEVLPDTLRSRLDLFRFAMKEWESAPSVLIPYDSTKRKTWRFYAENVHDFAFTADPTYRIAEVYASIYDQELGTTRTVLCQALAQESHATGWLDAAAFTAKTIETLSRDFGAYCWPKIIVADARDGMEYPMLTLDGGYSPGYYDLLAHEVAHMWFFGQVGNNETYRAALDEGFAQFIEAYSLRKTIGDTMPAGNAGSAWQQNHRKRLLVMDGEVYLGYLQDAAKGTDESINQISDGFNGALHHAGGYRHVYYKSAVMLSSLQYVLGDSLFLKAMQHYFHQWKFCHPYDADFRNSIIGFCKVDLNWFFDQWMETTKTIDYEIRRVKRTSDEQYEVLLVRRGRSQMPIDLEIVSKNGAIHAFHIPNTWFVKETSATVLDKWYGWDQLHPTYRFTATIPSGIERVQLDPTFRLADIYMMNNTTACNTDLRFDAQVSNTADWKRYEMYWRPDLWYNAVDGLKAGLHLNGDYLDLKNKFSLSAWFNSTLFQDGIPSYGIETASWDSISPVSFNFSYSTNTHRFIRNSSAAATLKWLDGLWSGSLSFSLQANRKNTITAGIKSLFRPEAYDLTYLLYPDQWNAGSYNTYCYLEWEHPYSYFRGSGLLEVMLRSASLFSDYQYADLSLTSTQRFKTSRLEWNTRLFIRIGTGTPAPESALYLAGGSPEEMMENKYVRSKGFIPADFLGYGDEINHFHQGGGLNLRGYAGYLAAEENTADNALYYFYTGQSGIALNLEVDFDAYLPFKPKWFKDWLHFDSYLFADAGMISYEDEETRLLISSLRMDAGAGIACTVKSWGPLEKTKPLTVRADFPILINRTPSVEGRYVDFRWVLAVGRSF